MAVQNYRLLNIDAFDLESSENFDLSTLAPAAASISVNEVQTLAGQIRQLLRGGDTEGALRGALENAPYGGDARAKEVHLATVLEVLQSIKQSEMAPILKRIHQTPEGSETLDALMKYIYKGMQQGSMGNGSGGQVQTPQHTGFSQVHGRPAGEGAGGGMSVLLSWHERVVEIAGPGSIVRVMTDRRTV